MAKNCICHIEWESTDLERTKTFFSGLFGWEFKPWGEQYMVFKTPSGVDGGIMKVDEAHPGTTPAVYVEVDDIEPYLELAPSLGGEVMQGKTEIPKVGWFALVKDPDGGIVGLVQEGEE